MRAMTITIGRLTSALCDTLAESSNQDKYATPTQKTNTVTGSELATLMAQHACVMIPFIIIRKISVVSITWMCPPLPLSSLRLSETCPLRLPQRIRSVLLVTEPTVTIAVSVL